MKRLLLITLSGLTLAYSHFSWADTAPQLAAVDDVEWQAIRTIKPIYEEAISQNDLSKLEPLFMSNYSGVMVTGESVKGYNGLVSYYKKIRELIGSGGSLTTKVNYDPGTLIGSVALASGSTDENVVTGSGERYVFTAPWTAIFIKQDGKWKIFRTHSSLDPVNNVFVEAFGRKANTMWGIGGLVLGVLASLLLCKICLRCCRK